MALDPVRPNTEVLFSVDVELTGPDPARHSVLAIGACLGTSDGIVIDRRRWALSPLSGDTWDEQTERDFWSKIPAVRAELVAEGRASPLATRQQFLNWVAYVREKVADVYENVRLVTDCETNDIGRLDALATRLGLDCGSLKYLYRARYTSVINPDERLEQARLLLGGAYVDAELDTFHRIRHSPPHDHRPEHDAERTYCEAVFVLAMTPVVVSPC